MLAAITTFPLRSVSLAAVWALFGVSSLGSISVLFETLRASYVKNAFGKHVAWSALHLLGGFALGCTPFLFPGSTAILFGFGGVALTFGSLALVNAILPAAYRPHTPTKVMVGVVAGLISMLSGVSAACNFFPTSWERAAHIAAFAGGVAYPLWALNDTSDLVKRARVDPNNDDARFDPINESLGLLLKPLRDRSPQLFRSSQGNARFGFFRSS